MRGAAGGRQPAAAKLPFAFRVKIRVGGCHPQWRSGQAVVTGVMYFPRPARAFILLPKGCRTPTAPRSCIEFRQLALSRLRHVIFERKKLTCWSRIHEIDHCALVYEVYHYITGEADHARNVKAAFYY